MSSIVEIILRNLMQLMPFRVVMSYEAGVRWTLGKNPKPLAPGFHWCVWIVHQIETVLTVEEVINLPTQSVITADGQPVCFSANIGRRVTDPVAHFGAVQDFDASTEGLAMTHLAQRVRSLSYAELCADLAALERSLKGTLATRYAKWGAEVTSVGFTDFVLVRHQFRLFQDRVNPS